MTEFVRWMSSYVKKEKGVPNEMPLVPGDHAALPQSYGLVIIWTFNELTDRGGTRTLTDDLNLLISLIEYLS